MLKTPYVAVIGAVNLDICGRPGQKLILQDSNPGTVRSTQGGVGRNIAHDLRLLGENVAFLTVFGDDPNGAFLRQGCEDLGMDLTGSETIPGGHTSTYLYITDDRGEMRLAVSDMELIQSITPEWLEKRSELLAGAAAIAVDGNLMPEALQWIAEHCTAPIFADPVSVAKAERLRPILSKLHTFKPNLTEGQHLTGETEPEAVLQKLLDLGVQRVYLSLGPKGILAGEGDMRALLPCYPTNLVNTTGGGDAVMAALIWAHLRGLNLEQSTRAALKAGQITVEYEGTNSPELTSEKLMKAE